MKKIRLIFMTILILGMSSVVWSCTAVFSEAAGGSARFPETTGTADVAVSDPAYVNGNLSLTSSTSGTVTTFTVVSGYSNYEWLFDGSVCQTGTSCTWSLDSTGSSPIVTAGVHQILVVAAESGKLNTCSASCTYTYEEQ